MRVTPLSTFATLGALLAGLAHADAPRSTTPRSTDAPLEAVTITEELVHPWGLAFLPDGRMLVTERPGRLRIVSDGKLSAPVAGVPEVFARGQGGLLDVVLHPDYERNQWVYLSYSEPGEAGSAGTAVARGRLIENSLQNVQVIWRQQPKKRGPNHFGSRLVFQDDKLFVTLGERFAWMQAAQDLSNTLGTIVRINPDGSIPDDNPFVSRSEARPEIWSYGHRNIQAAAIEPGSGVLWIVEHGPRGGDELNRPQPGRNYGWPVIGYGVHYAGEPIGVGTAKPGMEQPVYYWDPVIAPSGATFYTGDAYDPDWSGDLFVGSLKPGALVRLEIRNGRVASESRYLGELGWRIRDVEQGPDELLYLLTDESHGRILRIEPER